MDNFYQLAKDMDIVPLMAALKAQPDSDMSASAIWEEDL